MFPPAEIRVRVPPILDCRAATPQGWTMALTRIGGEMPDELHGTGHLTVSVDFRFALPVFFAMNRSGFGDDPFSLGPYRYLSPEELGWKH